MRKARHLQISAGALAMMVVEFESGHSMAKIAKTYGLTRQFIEHLVRCVMVRREKAKS